jgi:hypothetical protein
MRLFLVIKDLILSILRFILFQNRRCKKRRDDDGGVKS